MSFKHDKVTLFLNGNAKSHSIEKDADLNDEIVLFGNEGVNGHFRNIQYYHAFETVELAERCANKED